MALSQKSPVGVYLSDDMLGRRLNLMADSNSLMTISHHGTFKTIGKWLQRDDTIIVINHYYLKEGSRDTAYFKIISSVYLEQIFFAIPTFTIRYKKQSY
jgi:hypothetical protein